MNPKIKIYLVDDHKIFVKGVATLLSNEEELEVEGYSYDGQSALQHLKNNKPDIVIVDIQMPGMTGIELTSKIKDHYPEIKVLGLSMVDDPDIIQQLIDAGADGYTLKDIEKNELVNAIKIVVSGEVFYSGEISELLLKKSDNKNLLTKREKEIITLIAQEFSNAMIAEKLFISEHTVESHRKNIFRKTGAKTIVGLVRYAYDNKLVF